MKYQKHWVISMKIELKKPTFLNSQSNIEWIKKTDIFIKPRKIKTIDFKDLKLLPLELFYVDEKSKKKRDEFLEKVFKDLIKKRRLLK